MDGYESLLYMPEASGNVGKKKRKEEIGLQKEEEKRGRRNVCLRLANSEMNEESKGKRKGRALYVWLSKAVIAWWQRTLC